MFQFVLLLMELWDVHWLRWLECGSVFTFKKVAVDRKFSARNVERSLAEIDLGWRFNWRVDVWYFRAIIKRIVNLPLIFEHWIILFCLISLYYVIVNRLQFRTLLNWSVARFKTAIWYAATGFNWLVGPTLIRGNTFVVSSHLLLLITAIIIKTSRLIIHIIESINGILRHHRCWPCLFVHESKSWLRLKLLFDLLRLYLIKCNLRNKIPVRW